MPLVLERLVCNISTFCNSFANAVLESEVISCKLHSNACKELTSMANISAVS